MKFFRYGRTTDDRAPFQHDNPTTRFRQVKSADQSIVATADDCRIVFGQDSPQAIKKHVEAYLDLRSNTKQSAHSAAEQLLDASKLSLLRSSEFTFQQRLVTTHETNYASDLYLTPRAKRAFD